MLDWKYFRFPDSLRHCCWLAGCSYGFDFFHSTTVFELTWVSARPPHVWSMTPDPRERPARQNKATETISPTSPTCGHRAISIIFAETQQNLVEMKTDWTHAVIFLLCKCQYCKTSIQQFMDSNYTTPFTELHVFINSKPRRRKKTGPALFRSRGSSTLCM